MSGPNTPPSSVAKPLPMEFFAMIRAKLTGLWLIKNYLPQIGIALLYGHPGAAKSFFAIDLALHVALGWSWQGRATRQGAVVYVGAEGVHGLRNRMVAFRSAYNVTGQVPLALIPAVLDLQSPAGDIERLIQGINAVAKSFNMDIGLIVIDTLSKSFGAGRENTDDMIGFVTNCTRLAELFQCCVMPIHHRPKDNDSVDPRGHSSLKGGVDTVILVDAGSPRRARVTKQKDADAGGTISFVLERVPLGVDDDGDEVTSCVIRSPTAEEAERSEFDASLSSLPRGARDAYKLLAGLMGTASVDPPDTAPPTELDRSKVDRVVPEADWRTHSCPGTGSAEAERKAYARARKSLLDAGLIREWGGYAWITAPVQKTN